MLANINRDPKNRPESYVSEDFIFWRETSKAADAEPVLLDDPKAQSDLIRASMFGMKPSQ